MRLVVGLLSGALLMGAGPASSHTGPSSSVSFTFEAVPCAALCPRYVPAALSDPCGDGFPPGTFDQAEVVMPSPPDGKVTLLEATLDMDIDWDLYMCAQDGTVLSRGEYGIFRPPCDRIIGTGQEIFGCHEDVWGTALAGEILVVRGFNVMDPGTAQGSRWFIYI